MGRFHLDLHQFAWHGLLQQYLPSALAGVVLVAGLFLLLRSIGQRVKAVLNPAPQSLSATTEAALRFRDILLPVILFGLSFAGIGFVPKGHLLQLWLLQRSYIPVQLVLLGAVAFLTDRFITAAVDSVVATLPGQPYARVATYLRAIKGVVSSVIVIVTILVAMTVAGLDILPILAGAGLLGLTLSLSAQSILRDVISGLLVLAEDQFRVSERISINGTVGTVAEFSLRTTHLVDDAGRRVMIPNSAISTVTNYSRGPVATCFDVTLAMATSFSAVKQLIETSATTALRKYGLDPLSAELVVAVSSIVAPSYTVTVSLSVPGEVEGEIIRELRSSILVGLASL
jgi:small conductance mechanosensitive channel